MRYDATEQVIDYAGARVRMATDARFEALVAAFERAVPAMTEAEALERLGASRDWADFARGLAWESPSGFVRTASTRPDRLLRSAGGATPSAAWTIVDHAVTARIFRLDPGVVLYSALTVEAHASREAGTVLGFDVPSARLRSFGVNKIAQAGAELDRALGDLIEELGLPRPTALRR